MGFLKLVSFGAAAGEYQDIDEGVAGQVAKERVAHQALHQRLFERFSGTNPQHLCVDSLMSTDII